MANRWRLAFAAAALSWPALLTIPYFIVPAQGQSADLCTDCSSKQKELSEKRGQLAGLESQLRDTVASLTEIGLSKKDRSPDDVAEWNSLMTQRKNLESGISAARNAVEQLKNALATCLQDPCWSNNVGAALGAVLESEADVANLRFRIFELKLWLANHSPEGNTAFYRETVHKAEDDLKNSEASRVDAQKKFDELTKDAPGVAAEILSAEKVPKTKCAECEGPALKLEADLAKLRFERLKQARDVAEINGLNAKLTGGTKARTKAEAQTEQQGIQAAIKEAQSRLQRDEKSIAESDQAVANDRAALAACRCSPSTGDGTKQPVIPGGRATGPAATDGPNGKSGQAPTPPSNTPTPGRPDEKTPPSGNAPPLGIPSIGSIFAPTPGIFPGGQRFNFTMPSKLDNVAGSAEEYFTFIVRDSAGLDAVLALFRAEIVDINGYQVTIAAGDDPDRTWDKLEGLWYRGEVDNVEPDPCWNAAESGSSVPIAGAWILYTPVSPSPSSDPGERPGDEGPPTIVRVGRDGTYTAPGGLNGPVEMRVAMGCDEHTSATSAGRSDRAPVAGVTPPVDEPPVSNRRIANAIRASELRKP